MTDDGRTAVRVALALLGGALFVVAFCASAGCVTARGWHLHAFPDCADGLPVRLLIDASCPPNGICGYSCLPDRWLEEVPTDAWSDPAIALLTTMPRAW